MKHRTKRFAPLIVLCAAIGLSGCAQNKVQKPNIEDVYADILSQTGGRATIDKTIMPATDGDDVLTSDTTSINVSHISDGYITFEYHGDSDKIILQITQPDGERYPYPVDFSKPQVFNLISGDGEYKIDVLEHTANNSYVNGFTEILDIDIKDEFSPFLYPNQYADYTPDSECVKLAKEISEHSESDLRFVNNVFNYVISDIDYDMELAQNIGTNYIPNPDATLASKKGICFDYASLMTSMLRSQGVPTKLEVGYAGTAYHAWISTYIDEIGWVNDIIQFDGKSWSFMDPTVAANNTDTEKMRNLIGDGSTYTVQYHY